MGNKLDFPFDDRPQNRGIPYCVTVVDTLANLPKIKEGANEICPLFPMSEGLLRAVLSNRKWIRIHADIKRSDDQFQLWDMAFSFQLSQGISAPVNIELSGESVTTWPGQDFRAGWRVDPDSQLDRFTDIATPVLTLDKSVPCAHQTVQRLTGQLEFDSSFGEGIYFSLSDDTGLGLDFLPDASNYQVNNENDPIPRLVFCREDGNYYWGIDWRWEGGYVRFGFSDLNEFTYIEAQNFDINLGQLTVQTDAGNTVFPIWSGIDFETDCQLTVSFVDPPAPTPTPVLYEPL